MVTEDTNIPIRPWQLSCQTASAQKSTQHCWQVRPASHTHPSAHTQTHIPALLSLWGLYLTLTKTNPATPLTPTLFPDSVQFNPVSLKVFIHYNLISGDFTPSKKRNRSHWGSHWRQRGRKKPPFNGRKPRAEADSVLICDLIPTFKPRRNPQKDLWSAEEQKPSLPPPPKKNILSLHQPYFLKSSQYASKHKDSCSYCWASPLKGSVKSKVWLIAFILPGNKEEKNIQYVSLLNTDQPPLDK